MGIIAPVELLKRQYLQLIEPEGLTLPPKEVLRLPETQTQIYNDMFNEPRLVDYALPERYKLRVLKRLVKALEDAIEDPEEDVGFLLLLRTRFGEDGFCLFDFERLAAGFSADIPFFTSRRSQMRYPHLWPSTWLNPSHPPVLQPSRRVT